MFRLVSTLRSHCRTASLLSFAPFLIFGLFFGDVSRAQLVRLPSGKGDIVEISADGPQRKQGDLFIADKNVLIQYGEISLRADHVEYNNRTHEAAASIKCTAT